MKLPTKKNSNELKIYDNQKSIQKRSNISEEELILFTRNKIIKDIEFFKNTIPYIRAYIYFVGFGFLISSFIYYKSKNSNMTFSKALLLNLSDLEEKK